MDNKLSIIIPVYNEAGILRDSLPRILKLDIKREIIVVNDGSSDGSLEILQELQSSQKFKLISQSPNQGKGAAVIRGLREISGNYFIVCDADLEYDPQDIKRLWEYAQAQKNDRLAVYGSRWLKSRPKNFHYLINRLLTEMSNILFGCRLTDMETCFKLIPAKALPQLNLSGKRFEIEPEITARLLKNGYQIKEMAISYARRGYGEGKKIKPSDGLKAIVTLFKEKFIRT